MLRTISSAAALASCLAASVTATVAADVPAREPVLSSRVDVTGAAAAPPGAAAASADTDQSQVADDLADEIGGLVNALDSDEFGAREQATRQLVEYGICSVEAVLRGADSQNLEVATRCVQVLNELFHSRDVATRDAAASALRRLGQSDNRAMARRAHAILAPPATMPGQNMMRVANGRAVLLGAQMGGGLAQRRVIRVRNINGNLQVNVEENDRKIQITHNVGQAIIIKVEEPVAGKPPKTTEVNAQNLEELKQKHPSAYQLYKKYAAPQNAQFRLQVGGRIFAPPAIDPPRAVIPAAPPARPE